jgi:hypothetical protein
VGRSKGRTKSLPRRSERVIEAILKAEWREPDAWERDSYTIARMTVANAARGIPDPWNHAFAFYFGKPYEKALLAWAERDRRIAIELERCRLMVERERAQAVQLALTFESEPQLPPKKPPQSEKSLPQVQRKRYG